MAKSVGGPAGDSAGEMAGAAAQGSGIIGEGGAEGDRGIGAAASPETPATRIGKVDGEDGIDPEMGAIAQAWSAEKTSGNANIGPVPFFLSSRFFCPSGFSV